MPVSTANRINRGYRCCARYATRPMRFLRHRHPTGASQKIVMRLNSEVANALREPDARARLYSIGAEPMSNTPKEFSSFIHSEMAKWAKVVKVAGIRVE